MITPLQYKTRVDLALNDVFRRSEDLWKRKAPEVEQLSDGEVCLIIICGFYCAYFWTFVPFLFN